MRIVIFTDLDGTLLHPVTYSYAAAGQALEIIRRWRIPLVFCSSKTRAEIELFRMRIRNSHPFVTENGGGIFIPEGYFGFPVGGRSAEGYEVLALGTPYREIREAFVRLRAEMRAPVRGFGDMTVAEVAALTDLTPGEAALAKQREFDEPFLFEEEPAEDFLAAIERAGFRWTRGELFHITGGNDKGKALAILKEHYQRLYGKIVTIGLGDGLNDLPLLEGVDHPVLIRKTDHSFAPGVELPGMVRTRGIGPAGWNEALLDFLATLRQRRAGRFAKQGAPGGDAGP